MKNSTKEIWCTIGPSSLSDYTLKRLEELGVSLLRINMSHTKLEDVASVITYIHERTSVPVCLDTEGAQIRTGNLGRNYFLSDNSIIRVKKLSVSDEAGIISFYPHGITDLIEVGDFISIDFQLVIAQVIQKDEEGLLLRILSEGSIGSNKAVSVLNRDIRLPVLTEKDIKAIAIGYDLGVKHVALSFANEGDDILYLRNLSPKDVFIISKIETIRGMANLENIAIESDALLIDRGDLSRQVSIEQIPAVQKQIIQYANKSGIKIYVATNLLESMVKSPFPTRAEVNDIFNTLSDGADGLVLAAETAIGKYPVNCVTMVSKIMKEFLGVGDTFSIQKLNERDFYFLTKPHGGILINRLNLDFDIDSLNEYQAIDVDESALLSAEQIALGTFSPLQGFMTKEEVTSVLKNYMLPNGIVWPIPIVLQVKKSEVNKLKIGKRVALRLQGTNNVYATLEIQDVYTYDFDDMAINMFGANDLGHPGVQQLRSRGEYFIGGPIELIRRLPSEHKHYELTPKQVRLIFENKSWSKIVGFHTRNVIHGAHEYLQMTALEKYHCDGLFVHPIIGPKKRGDYTAEIILKSYELMVNNHYPKGKVLLSAFQNYSRYSGPREAVFTALCRKNFGCSHFIVGRDHTGVGNYYEPDSAKKLFELLGDIGIIPIYFNEQYYCEKCGTYVDNCRHGSQHMISISGTEGREMLLKNKLPPSWFMREDISNLILNELKAGKEVFVR